VAEPTLYLFDGYNLLHAGNFEDVRELRDRLASFVALRGARGVLVLDGTGADERYGPLEVRYAAHADALLERLAAEHRAGEQVCLVSSDAAIRGVSGQEVRKISSRLFLVELADAGVERGPSPAPPAGLGGRLDADTRARLERLRRGEA
jgi:predicted RNA-binding protein with PIN domain